MTLQRSAIEELVRSASGISQIAWEMKTGRGLPQGHQKDHHACLVAWSLVRVVSEPWQTMAGKECVLHRSFRNFSWFCLCPGKRARPPQHHPQPDPSASWGTYINKVALGFWVAVGSYVSCTHILLEVPVTKRRKEHVSSVLAHVWALSLTKGKRAAGVISL